MRKPANIFGTLLLCFACGFFSYGTARLVMEPATRSWFNSDFWSEWLRVGEAMRLTSTYYIEPATVGYEKLGGNAIEGMMDQLDQYSEYLPPAAFNEFQQQTDQVYVGIGVTLESLEGFPTIVRVFPGGGAAEASVEPGDRIVEAGGKSTEGESVDAVVRRLRGEAGTKVSLGIQRPGITPNRTVEIERRKVIMPTVFVKRMLGDGIGYIKITQFESRTVSEITSALDELAKQGMKKLVIDLRNNPGGLVSAAVETVGLFCPKGTVVTTAQGRVSAESLEYKTRVEPLNQDIPIVVIVNRDSASASEIVSGALQDLKRAVVVGDRTFGKGVVQSVFTMDSTHGLKITSARYLLPSGRSIQDHGVQPDIYQPVDKRDRSLLGIAEIWRELKREDEFEKRFHQPPPQDVQLIAAVDFMKNLVGLKLSDVK
ncbi:MAG: S41 family peptidase [Puniceicoccales bacterium]|nr:S41 family peptidase [Puniceicoccales bacterium]